MPRGDRTGPRGFGPMTGRAAGYCAGFPVPGYMNPIPRYGRGYGRGWGRGFGRGFGRGWRRYSIDYGPQYQYAIPPHEHIPPQQYDYPPMYPRAPRQSPEQELAALEKYKKELKADLEREMSDVEERIKDLRTNVEEGKAQSARP